MVRRVLPAKLQGLLKPEYFRHVNVEDIPNMPITALRGVTNFQQKVLERELSVKTIEDLSLLEIGRVHSQTLVSEDIDRWIRIAQILMQYHGVFTTYAERLDPEKIVEQGESVRGRILVTGLAKAGKTCTIKTVQHVRTWGRDPPTKGLEIRSLDFAGHRIQMLDLGGQDAFIEMYFQQPESYFANVQALIHIIDVQSPTRLSKSLKYLENILDTLEVLGEKPYIQVHFHKVDNPDDQDISAFIDHGMMRLGRVLERKGITQDRVKTFRTSIFNVPGLIRAFSEVFQRISPVMNVVNDTLQYYAELKDIQCCYLFTENGFILARYTKRLSQEQEEVITKTLVDLYFHKRTTLEAETGYNKILVRDIAFEVSLTELDVAGTTLYLFFVDQGLSTKPRDFGEEFKKTLDPWIQNYMMAIEINKYRIPPPETKQEPLDTDESGSDEASEDESEKEEESALTTD